jgi:hypothetical protein
MRGCVWWSNITCLRQCTRHLKFLLVISVPPQAVHDTLRALTQCAAHHSKLTQNCSKPPCMSPYMQTVTTTPELHTHRKRCCCCCCCCSGAQSIQQSSPRRVPAAAAAALSYSSPHLVVFQLQLLQLCFAPAAVSSSEFLQGRQQCQPGMPEAAAAVLA